MLAQDFPFGAVSQDEMDMKTYAKDSSANAVVLQEFGKSTITSDYIAAFKLIYDYHVKIKIFNNNGFQNGTVEVPAYDDSYNENDIEGITFYKDNNGLTQTIQLDKKNIYPVNKDGRLLGYKFAMPGLRSGCVIEFRYKTQSRNIEHLHSWYFQSDIPKIYSQYEVHIPAYWHYNASIKGSLKLSKTVSDVENDCFHFRGKTCACSVVIWGMNDIPAFIIEDHMTSQKNFLSAINFELYEYIDQSSGATHQLTKEWKDVDNELKNYQYFGLQLKKKSLLKDRIAPLIEGQTDALIKAKSIYTYLQRWFKWNGYIGPFTNNLSKALDTHNGSVADINLALVIALGSAGLDAEALLLSTRDNGTVNPLYPTTNNFDYVVAKVNIGSQSYYLDATDKLLPFGMLPLKCLNDKGRAFSLDKPSYWVNLNLPQKQKNIYTLDFTLSEDGKIKCTLVHYAVGYAAYEKRIAIKTFNNTEEYLENFSENLPNIKIVKSQILNLDSLNLPLSESYEMEIGSGNKLNSGHIAFNPFFLNKYITNPFKLAERSFPVDFGMPSEESTILTMHLPANYVIDLAPQVTAISLPGNGGHFLTNYEADNRTIVYSNSIQFNRSVYSPEEYPYLKELYNKIIQSEKTEIVFNKK